MSEKPRSDFPSSWCWSVAESLCEAVDSGTTPPKQHFVDQDQGVPFLKVYNLTFDGLLDFSNKPTFVNEAYEQSRMRRSNVVPGDVLTNIVGPPLGKVSIVPDTHARWNINQAIVRFRPIPAGLDRGFLSFFLQSSECKAWLSRTTKTTTSQVNLATSTCRRLPVPVAPLVEQERIVSALESYFTRLDDAVATLSRVERNLKRYRASVLKSAVEGRLVPTEAALAKQEGRDYEPASVLLKRTTAPPRPNRWKSRSEDLIPGHAALAVGNPKTALPEGWAWSALVDVARMESGHTPSREHPEWWDGDVPWIGIADARDGHGRIISTTIQHTNSAGLANSAARLLPTGTVCISRTASVGYVVVMGCPMATSQDFVNWTPTPAVTSDWLRLVFCTDREVLRRFGKGSVHKTIYFPEWLSVHIAVPPLAEQTRIVAELDRLLSVEDDADAILSSSLRRAQRLRQAILKWAFEGKLADQDPSDEPASVLLERIKAERDLPKSAKKKSRA